MADSAIILLNFPVSIVLNFISFENYDSLTEPDFQETKAVPLGIKTKKIKMPGSFFVSCCNYF